MAILNAQELKLYTAATYNGANAYDFSQTHPLIHLVFSQGSALFTDAYYETQGQQVRSYAKALLAAWRVEPRFPWQFAAWMRDPKRGKGNRIQGSLAPAILDATLDETEHTERYIAKCLSHRADDVIAFMMHYRQLGLGLPSPAARRGMARALASFDEYQLMKYASAKQQLRLCDVIYFVRPELEALGEEGELALKVGRYLHAPTRDRKRHLESLPMTRARKQLWSKPKAAALDPDFAQLVGQARVTWEQVMGHFGTNLESLPDRTHDEAVKLNRAVWTSMLAHKGLLSDLAFLRNLRNMREAGIADEVLVEKVAGRKFAGVWPHQVYAGFQAEPGLKLVFEEILKTFTAQLPSGRHLGLGDGSGSMSVKVGGIKGSVSARDVAFCFVGLMSETSGLGGSFADASWFGGYHGYNYLSLAERKPDEGPLSFCTRRGIRSGMGGTQVYGAVLELIDWLKRNDHVQPPDCLWFFSDMQFDPAASARGQDKLPQALLDHAASLGIGRGRPPLELALDLYRRELGPVDVVLWNLAAYSPVPVPSDMQGVLLVSGFDANTFKHVEAWRQGQAPEQESVEINQEVILDAIRDY